MRVTSWAAHSEVMSSNRLTFDALPQSTPPPIPHPLMQRVLVQIQLAGHLGNPPIPIDHTMNCLDPQG